MSAKLSVICVSFYSKHLLLSLIKNLKKEVNIIDEIVIVNNCEEDLSDIYKIYSNIKILEPGENLGYGGAANFALNYIKNDDFMLINPDISIKKFEFKVDHLTNDLFILFGVMNNWNIIPKFPNVIDDFFRITIYPSSKYIKKILRNIFFKKIIYVKLNKNLEFQEIDYYPGSLIISNKKTFKILGGFNPNYFLFYEEIDLCKRAQLKNIPVYITTKIIYNSNWGNSSRINVLRLKTEYDIISMKKYHYEYSGELITYIFTKSAKIFCFFAFFLLKLIYLFIKNQKIINKLETYKIRYKLL